MKRAAKQTHAEITALASEHVSALRARTDAFYAGSLSYESFGVKNREHWDRIRGTRPDGSKPSAVESRVLELLRGEP